MGIAHLANGGNFSMALAHSGALYTWGAESKGALGHCILESVPLPKRVNTLIDEHIVSISCGYSHCLVSNDKGECEWVCSADSVCVYPPAMLSCRHCHICIYLYLGKLFSWGANDHGQLGDGSSISTAVPHKVLRLSAGPVSQIVCGSSHSFVLLKDAYTSSQLPDGPLPARPPPMQFPKIAEEIPLKAGLPQNSLDHLKLLRNRFIFLQALSREVCGGELTNLLHVTASPTPLTSLLSSRLQSSACFGFWPLVSQAVGNGMTVGRLATLLAPSKVQRNLVAFDTRLDALSGLLLTSSKVGVSNLTLECAMFTGNT